MTNPSWHTKRDKYNYYLDRVKVGDTWGYIKYSKKATTLGEAVIVKGIVTRVTNKYFYLTIDNRELRVRKDTCFETSYAANYYETAYLYPEDMLQEELDSRELDKEMIKLTNSYNWFNKLTNARKDAILRIARGD